VLVIAAHTLPLSLRVHQLNRYHLSIMSLCDVTTLTQVAACDAKAVLTKKEFQEIKRREVAAKIEEKRRKIEELRAACKQEEEEDDATTNPGSASEGEADADSSEDESSTEAPSKLCAAAKAFYPAPPGLELTPPPGLEDLTLEYPPGLEPTSKLSADAPVFQYDIVPAKTKLTAHAQLFKSSADPRPAELNKSAPLFQPAALKAQGSGDDEKIMWFSSWRRMQA